MSQIAFDFLTLLVYLIAEILPVSAPLLSSASCPTSITYTLPDGGKSHTYDSLNRIATRTSVIGTITRTYQVTSSRILSVIPSSDPKTLMTYGTVAEDFRLKEISNQTPAGAIIFQHRYTFTKDSRIAICSPSILNPRFSVAAFVSVKNSFYLITIFS